MMETEREQHWNNVYATKLPNQVSWTQAIPTIALNYFQLLQLNKQASIIDIGGGESTLVDFLVEQGFENITVLDISTIAIQKVKQRLGDKAKKINWIVTDILNFKPTQKYDVWHDRATFHFLTNHEHINKYVS
ncbi:MAG TPA: class I SAM-dependent methyltransferase, partial [Chitinophagaceae bacterium]|nr:class I SAM-dependent methyltransferase [Chitinophagaceae bacterium]